MTITQNISWCLGQSLLVLLFADLITGLLHWAEDTYCTGSEEGLVGDQICGPNLKHHTNQIEFANGNFWHRNYTTFAIAFLPTLVVGLLGRHFWVAVFVVASLGNEIHAWSHKRPRWFFARLLQETCIVQTPRQHAKHHQSPHDKCYCTVTNVSNPILDRIKFWRFLEILVFALTGLRPKNHLK